MESRLANIVHHMTGEADEETMSAWGSFDANSSPSDMVQSLVRRSSYATSRPTFAEASLPKLDGEMTTKPRNGHGIDHGEKTNAGSREKVFQPGDTKTGAGASSSDYEETNVRVGAHPLQLTNINRNQIEENSLSNGEEIAESSQAPQGSATAGPGSCGGPAESQAGEGSIHQAAGPTIPKEGPEQGASSSDDQQSTQMETPEELLTGIKSPRSQSNDDDWSDLSEIKLFSANREDGVSIVTTPDKKNGSKKNVSYGAGVYGVQQQGSIVSGVSEKGYLARKRWIWAIGRVCQLIRRRKRKDFEIMSQRATDRSIRMGSRISIVEKHLDETHASLSKVDRLGVKALAHSDEIKILKQKVAGLSTPLDVEKIFKELIGVNLAKTEDMLKAGNNQLEEKLRAGQEESETRYEDQLTRQRGRLDDIEDRCSKSEETLLCSEERLREVHEEIATVTKRAMELEMQLREDEERLSNLESLKKAHQRRLSDLRLEIDGIPVDGGILRPEPVETSAERMTRLIKAAGTATDLLASDVARILNNANETSVTDDSWVGHGGNGRRQSMSDVIRQLQQISGKAQKYSHRCSTGWDQDSNGNVEGYAIECAEALGAHIEETLSTLYNTGNNNGRSKLPHEWWASTSNFTDTPDNGRRDLCQTLKTARDALLLVIGERTSPGGLRLALLVLKARLGDFVEAELRELHVRVSTFDSKLGVGSGGDRGGVNRTELEDRLAVKADVSWVQRELERLWDAMGSRVLPPTDGGSDQAVRLCSPKSARLHQACKETPETAGEESDESPPPRDLPRSISLSPAALLAARVEENPVVEDDDQHRSSSEEWPSLIKDLLRKTSRLEKQMASKADNDEVARALSSVGVKLRNISSIIPTIEEALSSKIEKKDLSKLTTLISNGVNGSASPRERGEKGNGGSDATNPTVLASRLNTKFRCLSCDRPLPSLGTPGTPKLALTGLSMAGVGTPRSPHRITRLRLTATGDDASTSQPNSPATSASRPHGENYDVVGSCGSSGIALTASDSSPRTTQGNATTKDVGQRRRPGSGIAKTGGASGEQPGRLEPIGANAPGELITGVMSRYPRMMPPPSRIRTAAGGGGAGLGSRPGSSLGGRL